MEYINISKRFIKESGNNLSKLLDEAIEKHDMYERFKSDQNFRYQIINVLGKNGIVIHGGPISFNAFDPSKMKGGNRAVYGPGAYFTDKAYKAEEFGMGGEYMFANLKDFNLLNLDGSIDQVKGLEDKYGHAEELKIELAKIEQWLEDRTYPIQDLYKRLQEIESELKGMFENESDKEFYELYHQARLSNSNTTLWDVFQFLLKS